MMNKMMGATPPPRDPAMQPDMQLNEDDLNRAIAAILPQIEEALTGFGIDRQIPQIAPRLAARLVAGQGSGGMPTGTMGAGEMGGMGPSARMSQRGYNAP